MVTPAGPPIATAPPTRTEPLFVTSDVSIELLELVDDEHPDLVDRVFDLRRQRLVDDAEAHLAGTTIDERVARVTELLDAQGYLCDWEQLDDHHFRINLHNCAIWTVAQRFGKACASELEFLQGVLPDADRRPRDPQDQRRAHVRLRHHHRRLTVRRGRPMACRSTPRSRGRRMTARSHR